MPRPVTCDYLLTPNPSLCSDPDSPSIPVLFIPGNAGSYQQGHALAAESARQWDKSRKGAEAVRNGGGRTVVRGLCRILDEWPAGDNQLHSVPG